jgi:ATP-dependent Lon protease
MSCQALRPNKNISSGSIFKDIPEDARNRLEFIWAERVDDVVIAALEERLAKASQVVG